MSSRLRLERRDPASQGVLASRIVRFLDRLEAQHSEVHSLMIVRHGYVVAEGWWHPYGRDIPHMLFSLSKSFTSTAVGLAWAEGRISLEAPVLSFFPEEDTASARSNMRSMQVRHLLMMGTGHVQDTSPLLAKLGGDNWVHGFFQCPVEREPGTHFLYNNGATYMLSAIIQRVTGQTLLEYLTPRLLEPLGIEGATWPTCPRGINLGNSGLRLTTEDIACFGQLYLNRGRFQGRTLIPEEWVQQATSMQISNGTDPESDWEQGYGYQFWRSRHGAYRGDGAYGQFCFVLPDQDAVIAITSGLSDIRALPEAVWDELLPALTEGPVQESPSELALLTQRLNDLRLDDIPPSDPTEVQGLVSNKIKHVVLEREMGKAPLTLSLDLMYSDRIEVNIDEGGTLAQVACGLGESGLRGQLIPFEWGGERVPEPVMARARWVDQNALDLVFRFYQTPFCQRLQLRFDGDRVTAELHSNTMPDHVECWQGKTE